MYVRSNKGKLIYLNINKFNNDKENIKIFGILCII